MNTDILNIDCTKVMVDNKNKRVLTIKDTVDVETLPDDNFNLIIWSDCNLQTQLFSILKLAPKLTNKGKIYLKKFNNNFKQFLEKCLSKNDLTVINSVSLESLLTHLFEKQYNIQKINDNVILTKKSSIPIILLQGLANISGFSCFMDSILVPMFLFRDTYFDKNILHSPITEQNALNCDSFDDLQKGVKYITKLQRELQQLAFNIRSNTSEKLTCINFKNKLAQCNIMSETLMSGEQQDDSEFLLNLMDMFNLKPTTLITKSFYSDDKETWLNLTTKEEKVSIIEVIPRKDENLMDLAQYVEISDYQKLPKTSWFKDDNGIEHQYFKKTIEIKESELLIFHIVRRVFKQNKYIKDNSTIFFDEYITNGNDIYALYIITVHLGTGDGGHYVSYFKYNGYWFHYDDIEKNRITITQWKNITDASPNVSLLFYKKIERKNNN